MSAVGEQFDFVANLGQPRIVGEVGLGDDENAAPRTEQVENVEMLFALRHHAVVGRDRKQHEVHPVRTRKHVADKALVTGDVDNSGARTVGKREVGKPEIDRDAALLFFL